MPRGAAPTPGPLSRAVAEVFRDEVEAQELLQAYVAEMIGASREQTGRILRGERSMTVDQIGALCSTLGLDLLDVIRDALTIAGKDT